MLHAEDVRRRRRRTRSRRRSSVPRRSVDEAIDRGVAYLLESQKKEGDWGTPAAQHGHRHLCADRRVPTVRVPGGARRRWRTAGLVESEQQGRRRWRRQSTRPRTGCMEQLRGASGIRPGHALQHVGTICTRSSRLRASAEVRETDKEPPQGRCTRRGQRLREDAAASATSSSKAAGATTTSRSRGRTPGQGSTSFTTATGLVALGLAHATRASSVPDVSS